MPKDKRSIKNLAITALIICAACFPLFSVSARLVNIGIPPLFQVAFRIGIGFLLTVIIFQKQIGWSKFKHIPPKDWFALILMGIVGYGISTYLTTVGVLHTTLINASVVGNAEPFFVLFFSILFLRDKMDRMGISTLVFTIFTFIGITIVSTNSLIPTLSKFGIGELYILGYAATSALYLIGAKLLSNYLNTTEVTAITMIFATLSTFLLALIGHETFINTNLLLIPVAGGLLLGGVLNVVVIILQNFAYKHVQGVLASQILTASTLFTLFYGYIFYRELLTPIEFVGSILVIGGAYLNKRYGSS